MLVKPEEVGLSSARLGRISDHLRRLHRRGQARRHAHAGRASGKDAYFEPQGHLEIERKRPVTPDSISESIR